MKGAESIFIDKKSKVGVLMLHGFSSTPDELKELGAYLAGKGFTVSAPLMAGHGTSPEDMIKTCPADWAESVKKAYLELKQKTDKIFIVGNSFGSDLAFWLIKEFNNEQIGVVTLGAPIFLKHHFIILIRLYTYGLIQKFYRKPRRIYKTNYDDMQDEITYPKIPIRCVREFLSFIRREVMPNLKNVKIPALVVHSDADMVIHPDSATYIYEHLGSQAKRLYWYNGASHYMVSDGKKGPELFEKIYSFMQEVIRRDL
jgi:carboxylesterase